MDRQQHIREAFEAFGRVRRLPADQLLMEWVNLALSARAEPVLSWDERRLLAACVDCGWMPPYSEPAECDRDLFDEWMARESAR